MSELWFPRKYACAGYCWFQRTTNWCKKRALVAQGVADTVRGRPLTIEVANRLMLLKKLFMRMIVLPSAAISATMLNSSENLVHENQLFMEHESKE